MVKIKGMSRSANLIGLAAAHVIYGCTDDDRLSSHLSS